MRSIGIDTNGCADQTDPACPFFFSGGYHGAQPGQTYAQTLANAGININDYISNGHNRKNQSDNIAPRFGFSYDLNADQQHVIFGGAGRSYDRNVFSILQHETNKATLYIPEIQFWNANNRRLPARHDGQSLLHPVERQLPDAGRAGSRSRRRNSARCT